MTALVDHEAAMDSLATVEGWLYLATRALAEPAHAALYVEGADPIECVKKLHDAVAAVEACRESVYGLRQRFKQDKS